MPQPLPSEKRALAAPSFYLTARQPLRPGVIVLAVAAAVGALFLFVFAMGQARRARAGSNDVNAAQSGTGANGAADDKDDPSQIDTIVLGDPGDAPRPARHGNHVSPVHPTIVIRLPREGKDTGMIPATEAGQLLYAWLAAFNHGSARELAAALPNAAPDAATGAQLLLRQQTGGYNLLSAKEVQPGLLVFRLRDQTPQAGEALGTLQVQPDSIPAVIASFSLRVVDAPPPDAGSGAKAGEQP